MFSQVACIIILQNIVFHIMGPCAALDFFCRVKTNLI